jgi:hypothetical protein
VSQQADKLQPGLTAVAREQLDAIYEVGGFDDRQDAYRLALAVALAEGLEPADAAASRNTYVNIGGLDPDGSLRSAVQAIRDDHDGRPVAFIERLAETGVARIHKHLDDGKPLRELLALYESPTEKVETE